MWNKSICQLFSDFPGTKTGLARDVNKALRLSVINVFQVASYQKHFMANLKIKLLSLKQLKMSN